MVLTMVLTAILAVSLVTCGLLLVFIVAKRRIMRSVRRFLLSPDENTPSQLAVMVDQVAFVFAQRIVTQVKTTLMGMNSVDSKNEKKEAVAEALKGSPGLAAALNFIPGARRLMKNPELLSLLVSGLAKAGKGSGNGSGGAPAINPQFPL